MKKAQRRQRLVLVAHPRLLGSEIRKAVSKRFGGNVSRAARDIGISQPQLSRMANGGVKALRVATLRKLRRLFSEDQRGVLDLWVVSPLTLGILEEYGAWWLRIRLRSPRELLRLYRPDDWAETSMRVSPLSTTARGEMKTVLALRNRFKNLFDRFDRFLVAHGHFAHRAMLAYYRIFDGLFEFERSRGIERSLRELSPKEAYAFLKAGITREQVLLTRSPDVQRAQEIALKPYRSRNPALQRPRQLMGT